MFNDNMMVCISQILLMLSVIILISVVFVIVAFIIGYSIKMGVALYKADFLYPQKKQPNWFPQKDAGPYTGEQDASAVIKQEESEYAENVQKKEQSPLAYRELPYKSIYDDYSQTSQVGINSSRKSNEGSKVEIQKKILLLPASQNGPLVLNLHKTIDEDLKVKSFVAIHSNFMSSRKSSEISLNSHQSKTIIAKQTLQPSIRLILEDTSSKGQCAKMMAKSRQAWHLQNYQKCIGYLLKGLESCHEEHPLNYFEKGIYHKRLGINYRQLFNDQKALQNLREALKYFEMELEPQIAQIALVLNNVGVIYQQQNKLTEALQNFGKSLQLKRQFLPENHEQLALKLCNIGLIQWTIGQHKKSVDSYAQALHINKVVYGNYHHQVAKNYIDLSLCLFGIGQYGLWLDYHYESLRIMKKIGLTQTADYKKWMDCFKVRFRQFLSHQKHKQQLVIKSLGMMTLILDKDDQIQFLTAIKEDLQSL